MPALLSQGLVPSDTLVVVAARDALDLLFAAAALSTVLLATALILGAVVVLRMVRNAERGATRIAERISADPGIQSLRTAAENLSATSQTIRREVEHVAGSVGQLSDRLSQVSRRLEERIEELNALIQVVQREAEGAFIESASRARGLRAGLGALKTRRGAPGKGSRSPSAPPKVPDVAWLDDSEDIHGGERRAGRGRPVRGALASLGCAVLWLLLAPDQAWAWGPATHIAVGEAVLSSLHLLPPAIRTILERHRLPFLYGSVAADISFAKKYAAIGRHSHHWHIGHEILESSDTEALRAVGLGYLSHLAADTIAHNFFVPRHLLLTSSSQTVGHTYWEHRMDVHLGKHFGGEARKVVLFHDHSEADRLFDRVLSRTLFSFRTNRRIFRGMIAVQDHERWQRIFEEILRRSRFDLPSETRDRYVRLSYDFVMDFLADPDRSRAGGLDPVGERNLRLAKAVRREAMARSGREDPEALEELAEEYFPLPAGPLIYVPRVAGIAVPGLS